MTIYDAGPLAAGPLCGLLIMGLKGTCPLSLLLVVCMFLLFFAFLRSPLSFHRSPLLGGNFGA